MGLTCYKSGVGFKVVGWGAWAALVDFMLSPPVDHSITKKGKNKSKDT
jgi:hypothetical protein